MKGLKMDREKILEFENRYSLLHEEDLERLDASKKELSSEARIALDIVLTKRNINLDEIRTFNLVQDKNVAAKEDASRARSTKRMNSFVKWFLILATPFVVLQLVINPERFWVTLVSSLVQALGLALLVFICLKKNYLSKSK
jgi:hypothetical protein